MAKLLPPYLDKNCKSDAERIIFNKLRNDDSTKEWIILHSFKSI